MRRLYFGSVRFVAPCREKYRLDCAYSCVRIFTSLCLFVQEFVSFHEITSGSAVSAQAVQMVRAVVIAARSAHRRKRFSDSTTGQFKQFRSGSAVSATQLARQFSRLSNSAYRASSVHWTTEFHCVSYQRFSDSYYGPWNALVQAVCFNHFFGTSLASASLTIELEI